MKQRFSVGILLAVLLGSVSAALGAEKAFFLKSGQRVCFYGYSITEQRMYTTDVETYVLTRFPKLHVRFINSGVGGDRVTGGWAGPIDLRLKRDVFPFKPDVVVYLLGMNDPAYQPFKPRIFNIYRRGLEHIISSLRAHLPKVQIVLISSTPWDEFTHPPVFMHDRGAAGSFNDVLIRYGQFAKQLAARDHLSFVNFNTPLVDVLKQAAQINLAIARQIIPGRIHPVAAGHLVMAQALLKAWHAPSVVTSVVMDAANASVVSTDNTAVTALTQSHGALSWTQMDKSLPMPLMSLHSKWPQFPPAAIRPAPAPNMAYTNPVTALVVKLSGFYHALDREPLQVTHLTAAKYDLRIDGQRVGTFTRAELSHGINLARLATPMMSQAYRVLALAWQETQTRFAAWRQLQLPMANIRMRPKLLVNTNSNPAARKAVQKILQAYDGLEHVVIQAEHQAAQPVPHHYELVPTNQ
jgi:lysophospholipase L1-like esterase